MGIDVKKQDEIKAALGEYAAQLVEEGMTIGLGTGTTATFFIKSLIARCKKGLFIRAVSSSEASLKLALGGGIEVLDMDQVETIDLTIDGADEVDPEWRLIKGKGGALLREKIVASASKKMIVAIDESKIVEKLGAQGLPVEVLPFGARATLHHIESLGYKGTFRKTKEGALYRTDSGNYIFDIHSPLYFDEPEKSELEILKIPGVIETGFFFDLATALLIGYGNGKVELQE